VVADLAPRLGPHHGARQAGVGDDVAQARRRRHPEEGRQRGPAGAHHHALDALAALDVEEDLVAHRHVHRDQGGDRQRRRDDGEGPVEAPRPVDDRALLGGDRGDGLAA
jgi:hypothetical protein